MRGTLTFVGVAKIWDGSSAIRKLSRNGVVGSGALGFCATGRNSEVGHEILAEFEVPYYSQPEAMGIQVDKLTPDQEQYLASWSEGT